MFEHEHFNETDGAAALGICESLLLALIDLKVISETAAHDLLDDVVATHTSAAKLSPEPEKHLSIVRIVNQMLGRGQIRLAE